MSKNVIFLSIFFFCILVMNSCGTKKEVVVAPPPNVKRNLYSDIVINYKLDKSGIRDTFNHAIDDALK